MNEQLVVKNFGPIQDATVNFKRVTVFIGPTGGGKSTLAKLAAINKSGDFIITQDNIITSTDSLANYGLVNFRKDNSSLNWNKNSNSIDIISEPKFNLVTDDEEHITEASMMSLIDEALDPKSETLIRLSADGVDAKEQIMATVRKAVRKAIQEKFKALLQSKQTSYVPSERIFVSSLEYSWPGLMRDDIGIAKVILDFANNFSLARKDVPELEIPFFGVKYLHSDGRDFIKIPEREEPLMLLETASGIQSVTPLLVLLEHLSRNTEQAQSFIIEEPELNLYPTAQQGLLNWLVEKCTKGENDLTITTHSPYILSHLNLLLYAYQVGNKDEEKRAKVKAIIPEEYWINPDEFAAYYVNGPEGENGIRSLVDAETKLISRNGLDTISGIQADQFDQLLDINSGF
jgi:predicted ATPase